MELMEMRDFATFNSQHIAEIGALPLCLIAGNLSCKGGLHDTPLLFNAKGERRKDTKKISQKTVGEISWNPFW